MADAHSITLAPSDDVTKTLQVSFQEVVPPIPSRTVEADHLYIIKFILNNGECTANVNMQSSICALLQATTYGMWALSGNLFNPDAKFEKLDHAQSNMIKSTRASIEATLEEIRCPLMRAPASPIDCDVIEGRANAHRRLNKLAKDMKAAGVEELVTKLEAAHAAHSTILEELHSPESPTARPQAKRSFLRSSISRRSSVFMSAITRSHLLKTVSESTTAPEDEPLTPRSKHTRSLSWKSAKALMSSATTSISEKTTEIHIRSSSLESATVIPQFAATVYPFTFPQQPQRPVSFPQQRGKESKSAMPTSVEIAKRSMRERIKSRYDKSEVHFSARAAGEMDWIERVDRLEDAIGFKALPPKRSRKQGSQASR
ncbi:MAG: hypothetical protein Q9159_005065 [Coniocarpon cinnabarinum]